MDSLGGGELGFVSGGMKGSLRSFNLAFLEKSGEVMSWRGLWVRGIRWLFLTTKRFGWGGV